MARFTLTREMGIAILVSLACHGVWLAKDAQASRLPPMPPTDVTLEAFEVPPPVKVEPPAPLPEEKPIDNTRPAPSVQKSVSKVAQAASSPPQAAQAGKTLTAPGSEANDVADFTMVQGEGHEYAGGTTSSIGTSTKAVRGAASQVSGPARPVLATTAAPTSGPDLTQRPRPIGADWSCSHLFPSDPDAGDYATVTIVVTVGLDGSPKNVAVLRDPGHGFAAAARACALSQRYSAGLDRDGHAAVLTTPPITVRFKR